MFRTRLAGAALLSFVFLPGCGILCGDRPGICARWRGRDAGVVQAAPVSFPGADMGACGGMVVPPAGTIYGAPIYGPGVGGETFPPPGRIPKAGIDEGKGKQFELEGASRSGPALTIPVPNVKTNP
jgi:hypothetical protein